MPTERPSGIADSPSLDADLAPTDRETESDEEVFGINAGDQNEGQAGPNLGVQDEGQAGPNPGVQDEGQAGSNPGDSAESQPQSSHAVHAGPNLEHIDLEATDASTQQNTDSTRTLSSLQNLDKELNFTNQFLEEKLHEDETEKTNTELEVQSMVTVPIHQDTSSVPPMATPKVTKAVDEIVTDAVDWEMQAPLRARFSDLPVDDIKEVLQQWMFRDKSYLAHEDHKNLFEALDKSLEHDYSNQILSDLEEAHRKKRKEACLSKNSFWLPSPPPPPSTGTSRSTQQQGSKAPSSSKTAASTPQSMAWTTSDTRYESTGISAAHESSPTDSLMNEDSIPEEQVQLSDDEDTENDHLPNANMRKGWWKPLLEKERPETPEPTWTIPSSNISDVENNWASVLVSTYEPPTENSLFAKIRDMTTFMNWYCSKVNKTINWMNSEADQVRIDVSRPLPLGGPLGHLTIQTEFFFNKDLGYLRYGNKGSRLALLISKMKVACYPDFGLELLKFYIERHDSLSRRREFRNHMRILSVVSIKAYLRYGYDYLSEIALRRADLQEYKIAEKDFKNLYPSDFEDLNLLLLQGVEDFQLGIESYQKQLNLTKPRWDAKGYEFKHDYTIIESPRAVVFPVNHNERKIMRFNEIYKFSDGTLTRILDALDYRGKEFKIKLLTSGMNMRFWTQKDVTRSKEFMSAIERRLKTRRIYQNLFMILTTAFFREQNELFITFIRSISSVIYYTLCTLYSSVAMGTNTNYAGSSHTVITIKILRVLRIILVVLPEHPSDAKVLTMKMEILLEPTSNKLLVDGMDTESEPFEDLIETETPESPITVAPPTLLPESTLSTLVSILRRIARMDDSKEDDNEEDEEIEESLDSNSVSEDAEDKGPTTKDEDATARDEGLAVRDEGPSMGVESRDSDDESHGLDDEGHSVESDGLGLGEEEAVPKGGLIRDHAVRLEELSPALFESYNKDIGEFFTRSEAAGQTDAQRAALWHAISNTQGENQELRLQLAKERHVWLDLAEIVDSMRRGQDPQGDV
ncbi:hypothetical protein Tco_0446768 [Tanacetum coccineum]